MKPPLFSLALVMLALSSGIHARGTIQNATVTLIDTRTDGMYLVSFSQQTNSPPGCVTDRTRMIGSLSTPEGRAVLAAAMLAFSAGSIVNVEGTGGCTQQSGIESLLTLTQRR